MISPRTSRPFAWILAILAASCGLTRADDTPDPAALAFFESRVRPILVERCQACHGAEKAKGGLRLDSQAGLLLGGGSGPAVVAGKPGESTLVEVIGYAGDIQMPPKSKLPAEEIATLTRWVETGAAWPVERAGAGGNDGRQGPALQPRRACPALVLAAGPGERTARRPGCRLAQDQRRSVPPGEARSRRAPARRRCRPRHPAPPRDVRPDRPPANSGRNFGLRG